MSSKFEIVEAEDMDERCLDCFFFKPSPSGSHGFCRRYPPVFTNLDENGRPRFWSPVVSPHGYCGEFEEMEEG
jgi:hypothetical protein